ncbi:hypothetical protein B0H12DRAFT_746854 [Mycena haematopus]|nr:hypothetical protein B0H12DRAFT_746854 [Mycena haematopus]
MFTWPKDLREAMEPCDMNVSHHFILDPREKDLLKSERLWHTNFPYLPQGHGTRSDSRKIKFWNDECKGCRLSATVPSDFVSITLQFKPGYLHRKSFAFPESRCRGSFRTVPLTQQDTHIAAGLDPGSEELLLVGVHVCQERLALRGRPREGRNRANCPVGIGASSPAVIGFWRTSSSHAPFVFPVQPTKQFVTQQTSFYKCTSERMKKRSIMPSSIAPARFERETPASVVFFSTVRVRGLSATRLDSSNRGQGSRAAILQH